MWLNDRNDLAVERSDRVEDAVVGDVRRERQDAHQKIASVSVSGRNRPQICSRPLKPPFDVDRPKIPRKAAESPPEKRSLCVNDIKVILHLCHARRKRAAHALNRRSVENVICVEVDYKLSVTVGECRVLDRPSAFVFLKYGVNTILIIPYDPGRMVGRTVIDNDDLIRRTRLVERTFDGRRNVGCVIVVGDNDADSWPFGHSGLRKRSLGIGTSTSFNIARADINLNQNHEERPDLNIPEQGSSDPQRPVSAAKLFCRAKQHRPPRFWPFVACALLEADEKPSASKVVVESGLKKP
ncbi:hypothetical protein RCO31_07975 [Bradyrhizobium sp. LHD-71]|nr:hypothetical protein [Bradyrhizobium sp. LHD-71]MDQ8727641.1 hypothetical protein [Bradyrhizobium sp. LHD-71]